MRNVGLDLGARHIAYCEVKDGQVVERAAVRSLSQLASRLGPKSAPAQVGFEACREGWHVHDMLKKWGHRPRMLDTTRVRQIGVGQHRRKNDAIDAEAIALAVESGRVAEAHVLSAERRALRAQLSVRGALVQTRSQYVTTIRGLARASGLLLPTGATANFVDKVNGATMDETLRTLIAPLVRTLEGLDREIAQVEAALAKVAEQDPTIALCATVPGVGLIVAATMSRSSMRPSDFATPMPWRPTWAWSPGRRPWEVLPSAGWEASRNKATPTPAPCSYNRPGRSYAPVRIPTHSSAGAITLPKPVAKRLPPSLSRASSRGCCGRCSATERSTTARSKPTRVLMACASRPRRRRVAHAFWNTPQKNFGAPPNHRTPRPPVPRPKRDPPHGGQEPRNSLSLLRRPERHSSAYPKSTH
jgi:transposase